MVDILYLLAVSSIAKWLLKNKKWDQQVCADVLIDYSTLMQHFLRHIHPLLFMHCDSAG